MPVHVLSPHRAGMQIVGHGARRGTDEDRGHLKSARMLARLLLTEGGAACSHVLMKALGRVVGAAQLVILVTALATLCPCPAQMSASAVDAEHGCCASEGFRAAASCCLTTPAPDASALAQFAPAPLVLVLADVPALPESAYPVPVVTRPAGRAAASTPVLRI